MCRVARNHRRPGALFTVVNVSVALLATGNLLLPPSAQAIGGIDYVLLCLAFVGVALTLGLGRLAGRISELWPVLLFIIATVPGLIAGPLNSYGVTKVQGLAIAVALMLVPSAFAPLNTTFVRTQINLLQGLSVAVVCLALLLGEVSLNGRMSLWELSPISSARLTGMAALFMVGWFLRSRRFWSRLIAAIFFVLALGATVLTGSRGPLLAALAGVLGIILVYAWLKNLPRGTYVVAAAMAAAGYWVLSSDTLGGSSRILEGDDSGRYDLYDQAIAIFLNNPLGIGWGNYGQYVSGYYIADNIIYPHNLFIEFALEGGVIALVAISLLLLHAFRQCIVALKVNVSGAPVLFGLLLYTTINAQFSSDIVGNRLLWLAIGLSLAISRCHSGNQLGEASLNRNPN